MSSIRVGKAWRGVAIALAAALGVAMAQSTASAADTVLDATADTWVDSGLINSSFGTRAAVQLATTKVALFRFNLPAAPTAQVTLRLRSTTLQAGTVSVRVATDKWTESSTWAGFPGVGSGAVIVTKAIVANGWTEFDVTSAVTTAGITSLAVTRSLGSGNITFASRTNGTIANRPELVVGTTGTTPPPPRPGDVFVAYSADSYFRTTLPGATPVAADSATGIAFVKANDPYDYPRIRGVEGNAWGMAYGYGECDDPLFKLTGSVASEVGWLKTVGFHAPQEFVDKLTGTSDSPFVVIDRCGNSNMPGGFSVWGAKSVKGAGNTVQVEAAGAFQHSSNGLDRRNPLSNSNLNFRSRGVIPDSMVVREDLLAQGIANRGDLGHVLELFFLETDSAAGFASPMVGAESGKAGYGAEGQRIRIKSSVNVDARACSPAGLVVARTLQNYGAYLGDNSGSGSAIKAEQGSSTLTQDALKCFTWDDFEFLPKGWAG